MVRRRTTKRAAAPLEPDILPQTDWQDVGRKLWARLIYHRDQFRQLEDDGDQIRRELSAASQAMVAEIGGNVPSFVLWLLRSRKKLTRFDRKILAYLLEENIFTKLKSIKKRGRPQQRTVRICASLAFSFYQRWKRANRQNGINDWGHGKEMKDEACRLAIKLVRPQQNAPTFEQVRELIDRPATRRECGE